ncbi:MAG: phenylalanine--tRNA ligase subunit beta [Patescibacteria group bacterium]|nr:phenylalanine--tRNA ligase subunit beta [Patescibacteria group bacterium]
MLAPVSWLKEYVDIKMPIKELAWRLTELGLGVESIKKVDGEEVLELEITPNRPDLLSIVGIAREIAAIEDTKIKLPAVKLPPPVKKLPLKINNDFKLFSRYTGVIIDSITIKPSPDWLQKRLILMGLRPINNVVDITNYVMWETGIPLHAFDYNEIKGREINVLQAVGQEEFTSVDELSYKLPKGAIIIRDSQRLIDLCGIKGGFNSGIRSTTKTVYLQVTADNPLLIRRASHALALRSDASTIFERGVDPGSLHIALNRAGQLILEISGGEVASDIIDISQKEFKSWTLNLRLSRLKQVTGMNLSTNTVVKILDNLNLNPVCHAEFYLRSKQALLISASINNNKILKQVQDDTFEVVTCTIPTYRGDLKIEEDLIEEVARVYGYNNYPQTIPTGAVPASKVAYYKDYSLEEKIKNLLNASGFNEIYTYSLLSKDKLEKLGLPIEKTLKVTNPVNEDYEYLRPTIIGNMLEAIKMNLDNFDSVKLFELGRIYQGRPPQTKEPVHAAIAQTGKNWEELKGTIENLLDRLGVLNYSFEPVINSYRLYLKTATTSRIVCNDADLGFMGEVQDSVCQKFGISQRVWVCGLDIDALGKLSSNIKYKPVPLYPSLVQDLALIVKPQTYVGQLIDSIKQVDKLISEVSLLDSYQSTRTIRVVYQSDSKTLTEKEVKPIREKLLSMVQEKFGAKLKLG